MMIMKGENIFRFISARPAAPLKLSASRSIRIDPYSLLSEKTEFYTTIESAAGEKSPRELLTDAAR